MPGFHGVEFVTTVECELKQRRQAPRRGACRMNSIAWRHVSSTRVLYSPGVHALHFFELAQLEDMSYASSQFASLVVIICTPLVALPLTLSMASVLVIFVTSKKLKKTCVRHVSRNFERRFIDAHLGSAPVSVAQARLCSTRVLSAGIDLIVNDATLLSEDCWAVNS